MNARKKLLQDREYSLQEMAGIFDLKKKTIAKYVKEYRSVTREERLNNSVLEEYILKRKEGLSKRQTSVFLNIKREKMKKCSKMKMVEIFSYIILLTIVYFSIYKIINSTIRDFCILVKNKDFFYFNFEYIFKMNKSIIDKFFIHLGLIIFLFVPIFMYGLIFENKKMKWFIKFFVYFTIILLISFSILGIFSAIILGFESHIQFLLGFIPITISAIAYQILILHLGKEANILHEEEKYLIAQRIIKILIFLFTVNILLSIISYLFWGYELQNPFYYAFNFFFLLLYIYIFYKDEYEWLYELSSYISQKEYTNEIEDIRNRYIDLNSKIENNLKFSEIEKELRKKEAKIDYEEEIKYIIKKKKERKEKNKKFIFGFLKYLVIPIVVGVLIAVIIKKLNL